MERVKLQLINRFYITLLVMFCSVNISAQTWNVPTPVGSTISSGTACYMYNVGSNAFLRKGGNYSTQAVVMPGRGALITPIQSGANWTLQFEASNVTLFANGSSGFVYTNNTTKNIWSISQIDATNNIYCLQNTVDNPTLNLGTSSSTFTTTNTPAGLIVNDIRDNRSGGISSTYNQWKFCTASAVAKYNAQVKLDRYMNIAKLVGGVDLTTYINTYTNGTTADILQAAIDLNVALNPVNKTPLITNPDFPTGAANNAAGLTGWTTTSGTMTYWSAGSNVQSLTSFDFNQTLSSVPPGIYIVKVQGFERDSTLNIKKQTSYNNGWDLQNSKFYATVTGTSTTSYVTLKSLYDETACTSSGGTLTGSYYYPNNQDQAKIDFDAGLYDNELGYITVDATGSLKIGISGTYYSGNKMGQWHVFDNFRLYYYGPVNMTYSGDGNWSTASSWSPGSVPTTVNNVTVSSGTLTVDQSATVNKITIAPGAKVSVLSGNTLSASSLVLNSDASGTGTFVNNGTATITSATVNQYLASARNWYISSPITAAQVPSGSTYFGYQESGDNIDLSVTGSSPYWKPYAQASVLTAGKGYIAQPGSSTTLQLTGTLNDGDIDVQLTRTIGVLKTGFNLIGNPYPSYLNWKAAYEDATNQLNSNVGSTIWYRTKNASGNYTFATYNAATNLGTTVDVGDVVTGNLPPMQAFWVRVNEGSTSGTLRFKNSMRAHKGTQTQSDLNTYSDALLRAPASTSNTEQKVLGISVTNDINSDEAILVYNLNATSGIDIYDSYKMSNSNLSVPEIYTKSGNEKLVINALSSSDLTAEIPIGFTTGQANTFTIQTTRKANLDGYKVLLKDKLLNTETDLTNGGTYSFTSDVTNTDTRFSVVVKSGLINKLNFLNEDNVKVCVNTENQIEIKLNKSLTAKIMLFNSVGQKLISQEGSANSIVINNKLSSGMYIVNITVDGMSKNYKVVIR